MAVKKSGTREEVIVEGAAPATAGENTPDVTTPAEQPEVIVNPTGTTAESANPVVPPIPKKDKDAVLVDPTTPVLDETKLSEPKREAVRIRMAVDHKCVIAMERYSFKKGQTYTVPANVKRILAKAGLLAPL